MENVLALDSLLVKIAEYHEQFDALVEDMEMAVYKHVNNFVGGYSADEEFIVDSLTPEQFELVKKVRDSSLNFDYEQDGIETDEQKEYIEKVLCGEVKAKDVDYTVYS